MRGDSTGADEGGSLWLVKEAGSRKARKRRKRRNSAQPANSADVVSCLELQRGG